jgi:hypothetical protein
MVPARYMFSTRSFDADILKHPKRVILETEVLLIFYYFIFAYFKLDTKGRYQSLKSC